MMKKLLTLTLALAMILTFAIPTATVPAAAADDPVLTQVMGLLTPQPTSTLDNERVVYAKYLLAKNGYGRNFSASDRTSPNLAFGAVVGTGNLTGDDIWGQFFPGAAYAADPDMIAVIDALYKAEALLWAFNLTDVYTGDPAAPVTRRASSLLSNFNSRYNRIASTSGLNRPDLLDLPEVVAARALYTTMTNYSSSMNFGSLDTSEGNAGTAVRDMITNMDPYDAAQVAAARAAFDALAPYGRARVSNYETLKKAEGIGGKIPDNLKSVSGRAPSNGQGYSTEQWNNMSDKIKGWLPGVAVDHIWIAGMLEGWNNWTGLAGIRINVDFNTIATDGKYAPPGYTPLTEAEWLQKHISFGMAGSGRPTHLEFLDAFDKNGVGVYLQVESGYADMITLMDIYKDIFEIDKHPSVKGFAVDVEWYYGFYDDTGIPVPNALAQKWNEHLYQTWGPGYQLLLKHYDINAMPYTYRGGEAGKSEKIYFCTDSQGSGSTIDGITTGFHNWAAQFPDNPVNRQTGYAVDRNWLWGLQEPAVGTLAVRLADLAKASPDQEINVTITQAVFNDPAVFWMGTDAQAATALNTTLNMLSPTTTTSGHPGYRFNRGTATLADAIFVANARKAYDALPDASAVTATNLANLVQLEPVAVEIRIRALPETAKVGSLDRDTIADILETYNALTSTQRALVDPNLVIRLRASEAMSYVRPMPKSTLDDERIVRAKYILRWANYGTLTGSVINIPTGLFVPGAAYADNADVLAVKNALDEAEARLWAYNLMEIYTGDPTRPVERVAASLLNAFNTRYGRIPAALQAIDVVAEARAIHQDMIAYNTAVYSSLNSQESAAATAVVNSIRDMNPYSVSQVTAARTAYDALTPYGKARVNNYNLLKKAEGTEGDIPPNLASAGGRAPTQGNGNSIAQWQDLADQMKEYFPEAPTEHVWIAGMLSGSLHGVSINVDFNSIAGPDGKYAPPGYKPLTQQEWRDQELIQFSPNASRPTHKQFLDYFDEHDTSVYLQVENGFADMITLIDIYKDIFDIENHPCIKGFAVDVEWYCGYEEDMGIPVPDSKAKEWSEHIYKTWGPGYRLFLKHYNINSLPYSYRGGEPGVSEKVIFCNDSQDVNTLESFVQEFQNFAAMYADTRVVFQIGYAADRRWFFGMDEPVIKSQSIRLAEASNAGPDQEIGIVWVQATFNDPLTFRLGTDDQAASAVNSALNFISNTTTSGYPGYRLSRGTGTMADAMFVANMRTAVNSLPGGESHSAIASRIADLITYEPVAVGIRISALPAVANLGWKDYETVLTVKAAYDALTTTQKAQVDAALVTRLNNSYAFYKTGVIVNPVKGRVEYYLINETANNVLYNCLLAEYNARGALKTLDVNPFTINANTRETKLIPCTKEFDKLGAFIWYDNFVPASTESVVFRDN